MVAAISDAEKSSDKMETAQKSKAERAAQFNLETNVKVKEFMKAAPAIESIGERVLSPLGLRPEEPSDRKITKKGRSGPPGK